MVLAFRGKIREKKKGDGGRMDLRMKEIKGEGKTENKENKG